MNLEKNTLVKLYSINYYLNNIEYNEIHSFYTFNQETSVFSKLENVKKFTSEIHGFYMKFNYKKFLKS